MAFMSETAGGNITRETIKTIHEKGRVVSVAFEDARHVCASQPPPSRNAHRSPPAGVICRMFTDAGPMEL